MTLKERVSPGLVWTSRPHGEPSEVVIACVPGVPAPLLLGDTGILGRPFCALNKQINGLATAEQKPSRTKWAAGLERGRPERDMITMVTKAGPAQGGWSSVSSPHFLFSTVPHHQHCFLESNDTVGQSLSILKCDFSLIFH